MFRFTNLIILELTRGCNLNCKYCLMQEKDKHRGEIIDFELFKKIINRIAEQRLLNGKAHEELHINFHGGECTLAGKYNFIRFLDYLTKTYNELNLNYRLGMQTNGLLLDEEFLKILRHYNVSVGISYDGINEKNPLRYSSSIQNKLGNTIKLCAEMKIPLGLLGVLSKNNSNNLVKDSISQFEKTGIASKYSFLEDLKDPYNSKIELKGKQIFKKAYKPVIDYFIKTGIKLEKHAMSLMTDTLIDILCYHPRRYETGCTGLICGAGMTMIAIRPDGSMGYCDRYSRDFDENYIEHALDYDFLGLHQLNKAIKLAKIKHKIIKDIGCDTCRANYMCENGCLAFYYSKFGKYGIQKELICGQYLATYDYIKKNLIKIVLNSVQDRFSLPSGLHDIKPYYADLFKNKYKIKLTIIDNILYITKI